MGAHHHPIDPAPGALVAELRAARGWSQTALARRAHVSLSLLSKVEVGDRALTPRVASALGRALGLSMADVMGAATLTDPAAQHLEALRAAMRDYDAPEAGSEASAEARQQVAAGLATADRCRDTVDVARLVELLPRLLRRATAHAHAVSSIEAWSMLADVYSTVYWLAARHRWMDLAELAVTRQRWAVEQPPRSDMTVPTAFAARDRAGCYLNWGDVGRGLDVVDRAIAAVQSAPLSSADRALSLGILHLRGMTLAGRLDDADTAAGEAERHITAAWRAAGSFPSDVDAHGLTFGPQNTWTHVLATRVDLGRPHDALGLTDDVDTALDGLPPTRVAPTRINIARAQLDIGDTDAALDSLVSAWDVAPQMARIHPMGREVLRVLISQHRRSNPQLTRLATLSGLAL